MVRDDTATLTVRGCRDARGSRLISIHTKALGGIRLRHLAVLAPRKTKAEMILLLDYHLPPGVLLVKFLLSAAYQTPDHGRRITKFQLEASKPRCLQHNFG